MRSLFTSSRIRAASVGVLVSALALPVGSLPRHAGAEVRDRDAQRVVSGRGGQFQPAGNREFLAWEANRAKRPNHFNVYVRNGDRRRVNRRGTNAANGGISRGRLVYQEFTRDSSKLRIYDLETHDRRTLRRGAAGTKAWEYWPSLSGRWLLFGRRGSSGRRKVILFNLRSGRKRVLDRVRSSEAFTAPGQVSGDYAVWYTCKRRRRCQVYRHRISNRRTLKIPNRGVHQRAPSVSAKGTVYLVRARRARCGSGVRLVRFGRNGFETLARAPEGQDIGDTYAHKGDFDNVKVLFDRYVCGRGAASEIFREEDPRAVGLRASTVAEDWGSVTSDPAGISCPDNCSEEYRAGDEVTLHATPESGFTFDHWEGNCSGDGDCTLVMGKDKSAQAVFRPDPVEGARLRVALRSTRRSGGTVTSRPEGISCEPDCRSRFTRGSRVELTADPDPGSRFGSWGGDCARFDRRRCTLRMSRNRKVSVSFRRRGGG